MTADAAARGIREHDADGSIALVGAEPDAPYKRPPLTKGLWTGGDEAKIWKHTDETGAELLLGRRIVELDLDGASRHRRPGRASTATRSSCSPPAARRGGSAATTTRSSTTARSTTIGRSGRSPTVAAHVIVIGGGFIGSELAASLTSAGAKVTMVFPEAGSRRAFCRTTSPAFVAEYYREKGVEIVSGETVASWTGSRFAPAPGKRSRPTRSSAGSASSRTSRLPKPPASRSTTGSSSTNSGAVDGRDDVFAAGDVANYPNLVLGVSGRIEHEDHANTHGRYVGENMAGASKPYDHLPFFYSDLFDLGYEAVGEVGRASRRRSCTGKSRTAKARSPTSTTTAAREAFFSGTCGTRSMRRVS